MNENHRSIIVKHLLSQGRLKFKNAVELEKNGCKDESRVSNCNNLGTAYYEAAKELGIKGDN